MRSVLGYLNQSEWIKNINIGNIMQIQPFQMSDLLDIQRNEVQLGRDSFIEKISILAAAYFCVSTEIRFILQLAEDPTYKQEEKEPESEYWHSKSLEIACKFLPSDCPLVNHIILSYQKHHSPASQPIQENQESEDKLDVVKASKGIDSAKFQPIIRRLNHLNIAITPLSISPACKMTSKLVTSYQSQISWAGNQGANGGSGAPSEHSERSKRRKTHSRQRNSDTSASPAAQNA